MIVGLTGGIGSGKTTVLNIFKQYNIPVYVADVEAKRLMNNSKSMAKKIIHLLGEASYVNNQLNKKYIASKVFNNKELLTTLNEIVHPEVHKNFKFFVKKHNNNSPYIVYESAVLLINSQQHLCDKIILVIADETQRIKRVLSREDITREEIMARIKNQSLDVDNISKADFVIENDDFCNLEKSVATIHNKLIS